MRDVLGITSVVLLLTAALLAGGAWARPATERCGSAPGSLRGDYVKAVRLIDIVRYGTDPKLLGKWTLRFRGCNFALRHRGLLVDEGSFSVSARSTRVRGVISFFGDRRCVAPGQLNHYAYEATPTKLLLAIAVGGRGTACIAHRGLSLAAWNRS
jgi:hypothetical protein